MRSKWVDRVKGTGVKSRFCATEVAYDARGDTHAGTPPLSAIRFLLSSAATKRRGRYRCVAIHDITCAFLHASMEGETPVVIVLPPGMGPPGMRGHLRVALYGTRRASFLWGEKVATTFASEGFKRSRTCGQVFWHADRDVESTIHGDDLLTVASG